MKKVLLLIVLALCLWGCFAFSVFYGVFTKTSYGQLHLVPSEHYLQTNDGYVFDTGAMYSVIIEDNFRSAIPIFPAISFDSGGNFNLSTLYLLPTLLIDAKMSISNIGCIIAKRGNNSDVLGKSKVRMILGTNVIKQANWLFSFVGNTAEIFPLGYTIEIPPNALCLTFENSNYPTVIVNTDVGDFTMLIDTGLDADMAMTRNNLKIISQIAKHKISNLSADYLYGNEEVKVVDLDSAKLFNRTFHNLNVRESSKDMLGLNFLKRFDNMFIDNNKRQVLLW